MNLFHGYEINGKCLKVEPIKDHEKYGRIRVPGKIIEYAVGPAKRRRNGELNTLRRATGSAQSLSESEKDRYQNERDQRRARVEKRKARGRYKNQQRKNSRATRLLP